MALPTGNNYFYTRICMRVPLFTLFLSALLQGCTEPCQEPDIQQINALYFELDQGPQGFSSESLEQIFIVRYVPFSEPLIADTTYPNGNFPEGSGRFFINDRFPFRNQESPYFTNFWYQIEDPLTGTVFTVSNIELNGLYTGDCEYINLAKRFVLNGDTLDRGGSQDFVVLSP